LEQIRSDGRHEKPLLTSGKDINSICRYLKDSEAASYSASDVEDCLLAGVRVES